ncbi:uncharacterized protein METZ01_LOCUS445859, partial [marine metagenome]
MTRLTILPEWLEGHVGLGLRATVMKTLHGGGFQLPYFTSLSVDLEDDRHRLAGLLNLGRDDLETAGHGRHKHFATKTGLGPGFWRHIRRFWEIFTWKKIRWGLRRHYLNTGNRLNTNGGVLGRNGKSQQGADHDVEEELHSHETDPIQDPLQG